MSNKDLEKVVREYCEKMVNRYRGLKVKFEYSEVRKVYLISYFPTIDIEQDESFVETTMAFEDKMNHLYGDMAPLFCDNEKYFKLSPNAELIEYKKYIDVSIQIPKKDEYENINLSWEDIYDCSWQNGNDIINYQIAA